MTFVDRCIQNLANFVQLILDGICAATGWKATLIAGGPEPANGGRLNVIRSVNSINLLVILEINLSVALTLASQGETSK